MKRKDLFLIGAVVFFSAVISLVVSRLIFSKPADRKQSVEIVQPIVSEFPTPDTRYFNNKSFDPTQLIQIGNSSNPDPFKDPGH